MNFGHIRRSPCKDILVPLKYTYKSFYFLLYQERAGIGKVIILLRELYGL